MKKNEWKEKLFREGKKVTFKIHLKQGFLFASSCENINSKFIQETNISVKLFQINLRDFFSRSNLLASYNDY